MYILWIADIILALVLVGFLVLLVHLGRTSEPYDEWVAGERSRRGRKRASERRRR